MSAGTRRGAVAVLVFVGIAFAGAAPAVGTAVDAPQAMGDRTAASDGPRAVGGPAAAQLGFDPDTTVIRVALDPDGTARWSIQYSLSLETENETEGFQDLQDDVEGNPTTYVDEFRTGIDGTVADASNATGREMSATNFSVTTRYDSIQQRGYVTYHFTWANFASETGDRLVAGDALAGFYLSDQTTLVVSWPEAYALSSADPSGTESGNSVSWAGSEVTFDADGPRVVVSQSTGGGLPLLGIGAAVGVVVAVAAGFLYRRRQIRGEDADEHRPPERPTAESAVAGDGAETETDAETAATDESPTADADADEASAGADAAAEEPPDELLSNEERVLRLLERHGGRVKQQAVVSELDWTAAKTSQVVNGMQDAGQIEKFRLGRENVLKLPDDGGEESEGESGGGPQ
jgi:uncharacterized membrane protein